MTGSLRSISAFILLGLSGCAGERPCAPPRSEWLTSVPADVDTIALDDHDRIFWNGTMTSRERLRDILNKADAGARMVSLAPRPGASCEMIEAVRLSMERSLSCGTGRCAETAPAR